MRRRHEQNVVEEAESPEESLEGGHSCGFNVDRPVRPPMDGGLGDESRHICIEGGGRKKACDCRVDNAVKEGCRFRGCERRDGSLKRCDGWAA